MIYSISGLDDTNSYYTFFFPLINFEYIEPPKNSSGNLYITFKIVGKNHQIFKYFSHEEAQIQYEKILKRTNNYQCS